VDNFGLKLGKFTGAGRDTGRRCGEPKARQGCFSDFGLVSSAVDRAVAMPTICSYVTHPVVHNARQESSAPIISSFIHPKPKAQEASSSCSSIQFAKHHMHCKELPYGLHGTCSNRCWLPCHVVSPLISFFPFSKCC
jgi:hypothetical protein